MGIATKCWNLHVGRNVTGEAKKAKAFLDDLESAADTPEEKRAAILDGAQSFIAALNAEISSLQASMPEPAAPAQTPAAPSSMAQPEPVAAAPIAAPQPAAVAPTVEWAVNKKAKSETLAYINGELMGGVFHTRSPGTSDWGWKGMESRELHFTQEKAMSVEREAVLKRYERALRNRALDAATPTDTPTSTSPATPKQLEMKARAAKNIDAYLNQNAAGRWQLSQPIDDADLRSRVIDEMDRRNQGEVNAAQTAQSPLPAVPQEARKGAALPEQVAKQSKPNDTRFVIKRDDVTGDKVEWQGKSSTGEWQRLTTFDTIDAARAASSSQGYGEIPVLESTWNAKAKRFSVPKEVANGTPNEPAAAPAPGQRGAILDDARQAVPQGTSASQTVPDAAAQDQGSDRGAVAEERVYTKGQAEVLARRMTNQGLPSEAYPHPTQAGMWAIGVPGEQKPAPAEEINLGEKIPPKSPEVVTSPPTVEAEAVPNSPKAESDLPPRVAETSDQMFDYLRKTAGGVVADGKILYPAIKVIGMGGTFQWYGDKVSKLGTVGDTGTIQPASESESADVMDALEKDQAQIVVLSHWGGSGRGTGQKVVKVLHSPRGMEYKSRDEWLAKKPAPAQPEPQAQPNPIADAADAMIKAAEAMKAAVAQQAAPEAGKPAATKEPAQGAEKVGDYKIGGYPVSGLGDKALKTVIDKSSNEADKEAASAELERRKVNAGEAATAEESLAVEPANRIADFGEKIGGARKDVWSGYKDRMNDAESVDIKAEPLSKSWPAPDYQALIDAGADPWGVAFARAARDEIPRKPSASWKLKSWVANVALLRGITSKLMNGEISTDKAQLLLAEASKTSRGLSDIAGRVELYMLVGHRQSLDGVSISVGQYGVHNGIHYDTPKTIWSVSKEAAATAWSNWPRELAIGDTRKEAMDNFKAAYDKLDITPAPTKAATFDIYIKFGESKYLIGKKVGRNHVDLAGPFDTVKEARAYRTEHEADLAEKLEKFKEIPKLRRDVNQPRVGEDMRGGADVTQALFAETFGFKGVEFGNWVEQARRQKDLNDAFDALMDMAAVLGVPPKALSLNGELGLAFGARGTGGIDAAAAHYEADKIVINLTKKSGEGSLGHEFFHALDNYFSRKRGKAGDFTTEALDVALAGRNSPYHSDGLIRKEMIEAFGAVMRAIRSTALKARSSKLDAKRSKEYWTTDREMAARAFESYLISKLHDNNASNDYLSNIVDEATWKAAEAMGFELEESYPYPTAGEVPAIRAGFDHFFQTIETKETDTGIAFNSIAEFADPSKDEAERVQAGIEGKDIIGAAQWLVDNAPPMYSAIASKVLASLKRQQSDGMVFEFHVMHPGDSVPMAATKGRGATSYNFDFRKNAVAVWINGADVVGKVGTSYETVLHELVHAATISATVVGRRGDGTEMQKHVFDLEDVTNAVIDHFNQRVKDAAAGKVELTEFEKSIQGRGSNAFASIDETLAWTLSSPDAQAYLEAIPYKSKSAWTAFVEAIRKILGLTPRHDTALSEVLRVSEAIMEDGGREMRGLLGLDGIQHGTLQPSNGTGVMYSGAVSNDGPLNSLEDDQRSAVTRAIDRAIAIEQGKDVKPLQVIRVRNRIGKLRRDLEAGKISEALFISQVESLHAQMEIAAESRKYAPINGRARGADFLRQKLLEAKRRGDISEQAADMAEWFILKNPALVDDLGIGIRTPKEGQAASGNYNPLNRVMTLFKESASDTTAIHEILHHLERMMPAEMQAEIRKEWLRAVTSELAKAQKAGDQKRIAYFEAALVGNMARATKLLTGEMGWFNAVEPAPTFKAVDTGLDDATPDEQFDAAARLAESRGWNILSRDSSNVSNARYMRIEKPTEYDPEYGVTEYEVALLRFSGHANRRVTADVLDAELDLNVAPGADIFSDAMQQLDAFMETAINVPGRNPNDLAIGQDYQYLNPSEFWAVRMTNTMAARFEAKSIWARSLQWLKEALEHIKGALGLASDHPLLKALDDLIARGTGEFVSKEMLGSSEVYANIEESGPEEVAGVVMRDVSLAARLLLHPRQIAANHKPFVPVFDTAIKQFEERDRIVSGLGEMAKPYFELTHAQRLNVNKIVEQGRLDRTVYTVADLENGIHHAESGDLVTLDAEEIGAYKALRKTFNEALSLFRDTMLEEFGFAELIPEQKAAMKLRQMIADGEIEESRIEWARHVAKAIDEIEQAKRTGYAPFNRYGQFVVAVKALPAGVEVQDDDGKQLVTGIPEDGDDPLTQIVTDLGGQYDVFRDGWVIDDTRKAVLRALETTLFATKVEVNAFNEWRKQGKDVTAIPEVKAAFDEAKRKYGNAPNARVLAFHITEKAKADDANLSTFDELARISDVDVETWDAVREKLQEAIKAKSFRKHFFGSDNTPGYSVDFERSVADYIIGMSGYLARRKHVKDFDNAIKHIKAPALAKYAEDYRKYVNSPADEFALLKNIGFLYYIAGSTATAVANLTQVPMLTMPTLVQFVPHHIAAREVARAWGETLAMFSPTTTGLQMFDPAKVPADVRDVFKAAWEDQLFVPLETLDLMAASSIKTVGGRKTMRVLSVTTQAIAYEFMFAERLNRITTFIAAARISRMKVAKDRMRDVVKNDAWARHSIGGRAWGERSFAEWAVDESQYRMGKVNRPTVMRGVGSPLLQFKGYMIQTLEAGYRMAVMHGKGGKPAALAALAMMLMLGGIWGLPGLEDLREMIERLYKVNTGKDLDLKTEVRQLIARTTGSASLAAATNKGIPYATVGVDMSRVGMGNILPDSALQVGGIPVDLAIARPMRAAEKMAAGKTTEAMSEFLPNFLKNPAMGLQWKRDGLRDKYGSRMMTPGEFDYADVAIKSLGWTPTKVTNRREYTYAESRAERGIDELKRRYTNDLVRTYVLADEAKDPAEKAEYEADHAKALAKIEEHNKTASPENLINLDPDTLRRKAAAEFSGSAAREGKERKLSRGEAVKRRELFQLR